MADLDASLRSLGLDFTRDELERVKEVATPDVLRALRRAPVAFPEREQARLIQRKYQDALQVVRSGGADGGRTEDGTPAAEHSQATVGSPARGTPRRVFTIHEELRRRLRDMITEGGLATPKRARDPATGGGAGGDSETGSAPHYAPPPLPASSADSKMREFEEMRKEVARRVATKSALDKLSRRFAGREARVRAFLRHVDAISPGVVSAAALRASLQREAVPLTAYEARALSIACTKDGHEGEVAVDALAALVSGGIHASMYAPLASGPSSPPAGANPPRFRHRPARRGAGRDSPTHSLALAAAPHGHAGGTRPWRPPGIHLAPSEPPTTARRPASRPRSALPTRPRGDRLGTTRRTGRSPDRSRDWSPRAASPGGRTPEEEQASLRAAWGLQQDIAAARSEGGSVSADENADPAALGLRGEGDTAARDPRPGHGNAQPPRDKKRSAEPRVVELGDEALRHIKRLRSDIAAAQQRAGLSSRALFMRLDARRRGAVDETDLLRGLRSVGVVLSRADARLLLTAAGTMPEASMTFLQFNRLGNSHLPLLPTGVDTRQRETRPSRGRSRVRSAANARTRPGAAAADAREPAQWDSNRRPASRGGADEAEGQRRAQRPWTPTGKGSRSGPHIRPALPPPEVEGREMVVAPAPNHETQGPTPAAEGLGGVDAGTEETDGDTWGAGDQEWTSHAGSRHEDAGADGAASPAPEALSLSRIWGQESQVVPDAPAVTPKRARTLFNVVRSKLVGKVSSSAGASELYGLVSRRDGSQATPSGALPGTGHVTAEGLRDGLRRLGLPLTRGESAAVLSIAHPTAPDEQGVPFSAFVKAVAGKGYTGGQGEQSPLRTGVRIVPSPHRSRPKPYATEDGGWQAARWPAPAHSGDEGEAGGAAPVPASVATPPRHRSPEPTREVFDTPPPGLGRDWAVAAGLSTEERVHHAKHQSVRCYAGTTPEQLRFTEQG